MSREPSPKELLQELCRRNPRYPFEAYEFLFAALGFVQHRLQEAGKAAAPGHVTGQQLAEGCRDLAMQEFGMMARTVLRLWNIHTTDDFGEMIYNLIEVGLMGKNDTDRKEDFHNVYDLDASLRSYQIRFGV
jgi:uncharacterized repeat protein (TIGR04138 family)